jgi:hypothetical protein
MALGASAQAADLSGTWIVFDGPHAGTTINSGPDSGGNFVSKEKNKATEARGFMREPNDHCPHVHFEGKLEGKKIMETDCLRMVPTGYAQQFLIDMSDAIRKEDKDKPAAAAKELDNALSALEAALKAGKLDQKTFDNLEFGIKHAHKLDEQAEKNLKKGGGYGDDGEKQLKRAINLKQEVVVTAPVELKVLQPPVVKPIDAVFQPANFQTVYTELATNPDGRTLTYLWALVELNDPPCVNFTPNSPLANQAIWRHPDSQCNHALEGSNGHQGVIGLVISDGKFSCTAVYLGSNTGTGLPPSACQQTSIK